MRMVRNVAMAMAILASATMAKANNVVWYTATGGNAQSTITTQGNGSPTPGAPLALRCDTSGAAGSCNWVVTMHASINGAGGGQLGWGASLGTAAGNGVAASAPSLVLGPFAGGLNSAGTPGAGAALLVNSGAFTFGPVQPTADLTLMTFTLTRSYTTGNTSVASINASTATDPTYVWANNNGDYENTGFAPNLPGPADPGTVGVLPSIIMTNAVPEPASLGLLAMGALALIRRRTAR